MNASISVVLYRSKTLANGENPLMIQVCKNGKRKYKSLGISVNQKFWDFKRNRPKPNCPDGEYIRQIILNKVSELQKKVLNFGVVSKEFTVGNLITQEDRKIVESKVEGFFQMLIGELESAGKIGSKRIHIETLNSIKTFSKGNMNFTFSDIDMEWLSRYEKWQRYNNNKETTIGLRFRTLRSAYNKAINSRMACKANYPFNEFKVSKFNIRTKKRAISKTDILKIMRADLMKENPSVQFARDMFIFSYLCGGINFTDIANLKPDDWVGDQIQYIRQKTGKKISVALISDAAKIITKYEREVSKTGYLFPILDKRIHITAQQKHNRIHKVIGNTGKGLKRIAELCKIDANLSTYVARHSFATILKNSGVDIALISETLGHSDLSTTQIYLDSFENEQIKGAMKHLL